MEHCDMVVMLDKKYHPKAEDAVRCPNTEPVKLPQSGIIHRDHGYLGVHKSGAMLICGVCGYQHPIARI